MLEYTDSKVTMDLDNLPCDCAEALANWFPFDIQEDGRIVRLSPEDAHQYCQEISDDIHERILRRMLRTPVGGADPMAPDFHP